MTVKIASEGYEADVNSTVYEHYDAALRESIATFFLIGTNGSRKQLVQSVCALPDHVQRDSRTVEDGKEDGAEDYENGTEGDDDGKDGDGGSQAASLGSGQPGIVAVAIACFIAAALF